MQNPSIYSRYFVSSVKSQMKTYSERDSNSPPQVPQVFVPIFDSKNAINALKLLAVASVSCMFCFAKFAAGHDSTLTSHDEFVNGNNSLETDRK